MSALPPPTGAPAGWYPDPQGGPGQRYFDGYRWHGAGSTDRFGPERPPHPTLPIRAAVGALAILTVSLIGGRLLIDQLVALGWPVLVYVVILGVLGYGPSLVWCVYASRRWGSGHLGDDIGLRFRWSDIGWGPLVWLCAVVCQVMVAVVVLAVDIPTTSNIEGIDEIDADRAYVIALLLTAVIAAPIVEEMVFRGVVMRGLLSRMGVALTIVLQAVLFGLAHVDPVRGAGNIGLVAILSGVGVALGGAAYLLRRIGPVMIAHAIFNGVVLTLVLTGVADRLQDRAEAVGTSSARVERAVVDQTHAADPGGQHQQCVLAVDHRDGGERPAIHHGGVLELDPGLLGQHGAHGVLDDSRGALASRHQLTRRGE